MADVFDLERRTQVSRPSSYILSYPHILSYFEAKTTFDAADFVRGAHMVYGWMPTILEIHLGPTLDLDAGARLLTRAKNNGTLSDADISSLANIVSNSLVGASKLLHFVAPERFAIWDARIYTFMFAQRPYPYRVGKVANYRRYVSALDEMQTDARFSAFHESVNAKVGYPVSPLRALELVMFLNAKEADWEGDMQPGPGLFELAKEPGRDTSDIPRSWVDELHAVHRVWSDES